MASLFGERPSLLTGETTTKCMTRSLNVTPKTTLRSGKSWSLSNYNKRIRTSYYFVEANYTDGHKASSGLSATAELLVLYSNLYRFCLSPYSVSAIVLRGTELPRARRWYTTVFLRANCVLLWKPLTNVTNRHVSSANCQSLWTGGRLFLPSDSRAYSRKLSSSSHEPSGVHRWPVKYPLQSIYRPRSRPMECSVNLLPSKKFDVVLTSGRRREYSPQTSNCDVAGPDFCRLPKTSSRRRRRTSNTASSCRRVDVGFRRRAGTSERGRVDVAVRRPGLRRYAVR